MRCSILTVLFLSNVALSSSAFANAGATSSGVTTTVGNSNEPSADVQAQSAGFVQQNQQAQQAGQAPSGVVLPIGVPVPPSDGSAAAVDANGKRVKDPKDAAAAAAQGAPAVPPPPPPVYESTMHRLEKRNTPTTPAPMTVEASGPVGAVRKDDAQPPVKPAEPAPIAPAATPQAQATPAPAAPRVSPPAPEVAPEHITPPAITGGRGAAPDGFTFYSGVTISGALLAFALATFVRMGRNEGSQ
jgi:hypothetical protein